MSAQGILWKLNNRTASLKAFQWSQMDETPKIHDFINVIYAANKW
jgi:hypothetical protein